MSNRLASWTEMRSPYPALFNAYRDGDTVTITVRTERQPDGKEGSTSYAQIPVEAAFLLALELAEALRPRGDIHERLASIAGVPCRFCFGHGNANGPCPDCGKPNKEIAEGTAE